MKKVSSDSTLLFCANLTATSGFKIVLSYIFQHVKSDKKSYVKITLRNRKVSVLVVQVRT